MKITAQEEYGLRCLLRFARAGKGEPLTLAEIAAGEGLSVPYAAKLLSVLRQAGLIESARGRNGGYRLSSAPAEISLGSVLLALGEPLFDDPDYCQRHAGTETHGTCVHHDGCTLRELWHSLDRYVRDALGRITLADLLRGEGQITELVRSRMAKATAPGMLIPLAVPRGD
jgi:Rrf2 family protein